MSLFARLWRAFRNPTRFVGHDLEGNRFFEFPSPHPGARTRRTVEYRNPEDMWDYVGGKKRLPIQWTSWLSHTRANPPTLQELQMDLERQQRVLANAALIEAREAEERRRMLQLGAETVNVIETPRATETTASTPQPKEAEPQPNTAEEDPWARASKEASDTQSWTPRARRRGSGNAS